MSYVYNMFSTDSVQTPPLLQCSHFYSRVWVLKVVCCACAYRSDNVRTTGSLFMEFDSGEFSENLSSHQNFHLDWTVVMATTF
jgi:hypothetical protein